MTISYTNKVSKSRIGSFIRVIFLWKGSIYKLVYKEFFLFILLYYMINIFYRFAMTENQRGQFEQIVLYCDTFVNLIPLPFVLGFFVSLIVGRWWAQFQSIPFPDETMIMVNSLIQGKDEKSRLIRRTLMRYLNLTSVLIFRSISAPVKRRFPDMESVVEAGFMTYKELKIFENLATPHSKWWLPCIWFSNLVVGSYNEKRLINDFSLRVLLMLAEFRNKCAALYAYDWISVPLVYTQVVSLANYMYFIANLMGRQILDPTKRYTNRFDIYFPVFTFLQFLFYMGWLKVAEQLMNPFGEDEDDFEINWIIDRNFQISMLAVDELHSTFPDLEKDVYWDDPEPELPYTEASKFYKRNSWMGSTADIHLTRDDVNEIDWLSQENLKNLNPLNSFQDALHRLSSKSFARSRKSNQSIKSEILDNQHKIKMNTNLNPFFSQYPSSRSSISNHFSQNGLKPIKEQRFEVTKIKDDDTSTRNGKMMFNFSNHLHNDQNILKKPVILVNGKLDVETKINNNNTDTIPENDFTNPTKRLNSDLNNISNGNLIILGGGRKKKISAGGGAGGDNNSTFTEENDLTVKGNISNLAKFHSKKMRERMLRASAGYVAEDFTNNDTPYIKKPVLNGSFSAPPSAIKVGKQRLITNPPSKNILRKLSSRLKIKSSSSKASRETNQFVMDNSLIRHSKRKSFNLSSKKRRKKKSSNSKKLDYDYHPFIGSKDYTTNKWVPEISRASLTSEIKSWIFPSTMTRNKDSQLLFDSTYNDNFDNPDNPNDILNNNRVRKDGVSHLNNYYSSYQFLTSKNLSKSIKKSTLPDKDPPLSALTVFQASSNQRSVFPYHASPKKSIYKRQMSLPHNERLLEEDEGCNNNSASEVIYEKELLPHHCAEVAIKVGNSYKKIKGVSTKRNIKELLNNSNISESQLNPVKELKVEQYNMAYLEDYELEATLEAKIPDGKIDKENVAVESKNKDNNSYTMIEITNI
ncbi:bestrophin homolog 24-like isoform X2 [Gordionus sp. m RMFG-2023]|uniref:bestrophin homolog 24-like isoform X2 n=1 Tax=Gordionus sp. m RMFG-2023 TaxID=3053472 RepID=UPI0031FCA8B7